MECDFDFWASQFPKLDKIFFLFFFFFFWGGGGKIKGNDQGAHFVL